MPHDSMVTVRLSEPPTLTVDSIVVETSHNDNNEHIKVQEKPDIILDEGEDQEQEELRAEMPEEEGGGEAEAQEESPEDSPRITMVDSHGNEVTSPVGPESETSQDGESSRLSDSSASDGEVNWEELEKTEEQEPRDEGSDDVSQSVNILEFC